MDHSSSDALVFFPYRTSDSPVYDDAPQTWRHSAVGAWYNPVTSS